MSLARLAGALLVGAAGVVAGCSGDIGEPAPETPTTVGAPPEVIAATEQPFELTTEQAVLYLAKLAPALVRRVLSVDERARIAKEGSAAVRPILAAWTKEPGFAETARELVELKLSVSGSRDGVDFGLPGNLAAHLAKHDLAWSRLVTEPKCFDRADKEIACDTGAPYAAGVLTTRAYMVSRASRFNLTRSSTLMAAFACRGYPQEDTLQPRIPKSQLIPMFRAITAEEQTDERARSGFGNGSGCYMCHGQFSAHAQLFVRFDEKGLWRADATGIQDPTGELGRSKDGLMASHFVDATAAASETTQLFGTAVKNLADAGRVLAKSPVFLQCASRNVIQHSLGPGRAPEGEDVLLRELATRANDVGGADPSFGSIVIATLTHPDVQRSVVKMLTGVLPPPNTPSPDANATSPGDAG